MSEKKIESDSIFCCLCGKNYNNARGASQHLIFAHKVRYPYAVLFYKGLLASPDLDLEAIPPPSPYRAPGRAS